MKVDSQSVQNQARSERPIAVLVRLRAMRRALWMRQLWAEEPDSVHPAAIQHEEVDRILSDPGELAGREAAFYEEDTEAAALSRAIEEASGAVAQDENWQRVVKAFGLTVPEQELLSLAVAFGLEPTLGRAFAYLHDQPEMTHATPWLAAALSGPGAEPVPLTADSALLRWRLVGRSSDPFPVQGVWTGWVADPAIVAWVEGGDGQSLPLGTVRSRPEAFESLPILHWHAFGAAMEFLEAVYTGMPTAMEIELVGTEGCGRGTLAGQIAARVGKSLVAVDESELLEGTAPTDAPQLALAAARWARLRDAILYWRESREPSTAARRALRTSRIPRIVGRTAPLSDSPPETVFRSIELAPLSRESRERLWSVCSEADVPWQVRDWMLSPGEIVRLASVVDAGDVAIQQACRRPMESLSLLSRLPLPYSASDLILPESIQRAMDDFENQIRFRWDVYERWGFERLCPNGRGLIALFAGPSGTGKTMAAQVLARRLGLELYRLDPAQVVNKFIGETEKRLKVIFDECDRAHFLLLIDECEGMFGQRFSSRDAHDRYANLEIDYLLQRLERFQGIAVLSTNRKGDLDPAFLRRIRFLIDFLPPGPSERAKLWQSALPPKSPSGEDVSGAIDWNELAGRVPLTGAEIKLAALNAAFLARAAGEKIEMAHVLEAVRRELAKKGQTLRGFE